MSFDNVIYEKGEVATLTLNRPDISNGFNIPTCQEILEVLDLVKADDSVKILVIQAVGKIFSIGGDLAEMQRAVESDNVESLVEIASLVNKISFAMKKLPKPVIMSVDGAVAGAAAIWLLRRILWSQVKKPNLFKPLLVLVLLQMVEEFS